jgi:DNA-binding GntR family transcriptional regulator
MTTRDSGALRFDTRLPRQVSERLRAEIASGALAPGARLIPAEIAERLGVSRGPVREAIIEMVQQGLVVQPPRRAAYVRGQLSRDEIEKMGLLRGQLEGLAARLALRNCQSGHVPDGGGRLASLVEHMRRAGAEGDRLQVSKLDAEFHQSLTRMADFPILERTLGELRQQVRALIDNSNLLYEDPGTVWRSHQVLIDAFTSGDEDRVAAAARHHAETAAALILRGMPL